MRTDSVNLSNEALAAMSEEIVSKLGERYLHVRRFHTSSKGAQEAHEAIRPTYISRETIDEATAQEKKLYALIRKRALASQMADAEVEKTTVDIRISGRPESFTATGEVIKFDGFLRMYLESREDDNLEESGADGRLPALSGGETLSCEEIAAVERFTQHPPRYTEASLVKKMEELGIGRPSTYAPTISTIQQREYVVRGEKEGTPRDFETLTLSGGKITAATRTENAGSDRGKLVPTDIGMIVNEFLTEYFPDILDYNFTARIEERFDDIAEGKLPWNEEISNFYGMFHPAVEGALSHKTGPKFGERRLGVDPATGLPVSVKIGRFGPVVQIGDTEGEEKPRFASLHKDQSIQDITLEEALKLFEFPRILGDYEGKEVSVAIGRFGPYVKHDGKFVSIPAETPPAELTLGQAVELIDAKRREDASKVMKTFDEDAELRILNGRYGPYIVYKKSNYKIPKSVASPGDLSYEEAMEIIKAADEAPAKPRLCYVYSPIR